MIPAEPEYEDYYRLRAVVEAADARFTDAHYGGRLLTCDDERALLERRKDARDGMDRIVRAWSQRGVRVPMDEREKVRGA